MLLSSRDLNLESVQASACYCRFKAARSRAFKSISFLRHYYTLCHGRELSLHSRHGVRHALTHTPNTHASQTSGDNGVCECSGAAPGSAQAGLGTTAPFLEADRRQKENLPAEEIILGEDHVEEKLG